MLQLGHSAEIHLTKDLHC